MRKKGRGVGIMDNNTAGVILVIAFLIFGIAMSYISYKMKDVEVNPPDDLGK